MPIRSYIFILIVLPLASGCDDAFSPKGPYEEKLVLYSIISNTSDTQYVRIYTTYNPKGFDPLSHTNETQVSDATVSLTRSGSAAILRDTIVVRWEKARYQSDIKAYVTYGHKVNPGDTYTLKVQSAPRGPIEAEIKVPEEGVITVGNTFVLTNPGRFLEDVLVRARISGSAQGYLVRFFIDYAYKKNGLWIEQSLEVPEKVEDVVDCLTFRGTYPRLSRKTQVRDPESIFFQRNAYTVMLGNLWSSFSKDSLKIRRARFELVQVERHLYRYFNIVNGFQDEVSIRTDEPDYSNIKGAIGLFGAFYKQSVSVELPDTIGISSKCR